MCKCILRHLPAVIYGAANEKCNWVLWQLRPSLPVFASLLSSESLLAALLKYCGSAQQHLVRSETRLGYAAAIIIAIHELCLAVLPVSHTKRMELNLDGQGQDNQCA